MKKIVALAVSLVFAASVYAADFQDITVSGLQTAISSQKVVLLDANGTECWQSGHIPGAINFAATRDNLAAVLPQDKNVLVVAYCHNPKCGAYHAAAVAAKKLGYKNIKHLVAGIEGWEKAGLKTEKGN